MIIAAAASSQAQGACLQEYPIALGNPSYTVAVGRRLLVRLSVVNDAATQPMMIAYGTTAYPSRLVLLCGFGPALSPLQ